MVERAEFVDTARALANTLTVPLPLDPTVVGELAVPESFTQWFNC